MKKYLWDVWLVPGTDANLMYGVHYVCSTKSFTQQVRNAARAMKVLVSIVKTVRPKGVIVTTRNRRDGENVPRH